MPRFLIPDHVADLIRNLHPHIKKKVRSSFERILSDGEAGKALVDELEGLKSFRIGRMRIIYRVNVKKNIEIIAVGSRETIYEKTYRMLKEK